MPKDAGRRDVTRDVNEQKKFENFFTTSVAQVPDELLGQAEQPDRKHGLLARFFGRLEKNRGAPLPEGEEELFRAEPLIAPTGEIMLDRPAREESDAGLELAARPSLDDLTRKLRGEPPEPEQPSAPAVPEPAPGNQPVPAAASSSAAGGGGAGSSAGAGSGTGTGSGVGDGTGDGQGYGEGAGDGQGSGYSGAEGTGSSPFDSDGFWSAVNANKSYPPMAVRRGLTGSVTVTVTLDSSGNCVNAYVSGSSGQSILDKAALNAVYAACPYPNASGQDVTVNVPVTFNLN